MKKLVFVLILLVSSALYSMDFSGKWEFEPDYSSWARIFFSRLEIENENVTLIVRTEPKNKNKNSEFKTGYRKVKGKITNDKIILNQLWKISESKWIDLQDEKWEWAIVDIEEDSFYIVNPETQEKLIVKRVK